MAHTSNDLLRDNEEPSTLCRILENGVIFLAEVLLSATISSQISTI